MHFFSPNLEKKNPIIAENNFKHSDIQTLLFEMALNFDFKLLFNDSKWNSFISYVTLEDIINFECFENFPNSGFASLNFQIN